MEIITRHLDGLKKRENYLNVNIGNKFKGGKDTGVKSIIVYVKRKQPCVELAESECLPTELEGVPVDVQEINPPAGTWTAGRTSISEMHPLDQIHRLGAPRKVKEKTAQQNRKITVSAPLYFDWIGWFSAIQNQKNCGSCVSFGNIGIIEALYRLLEGIMNDPIKLSEALAFFCSGGNCEDGSTPNAFLDYMIKSGTTLEQYCPYVDQDQACQSGVLPGWQDHIYKIASYADITDLNAIRTALTHGPVNACMDVPQSFFNYQAGVYVPLANDPIQGGHDVGNIGLNDSLGAYHGRNSWDVTWGEKGYFWIKYGECGFDSEAWVPVPILNPVPVPPVPVKKKCWIFSSLAAHRQMKTVKM
jgi:C1A family cysteine protease